jgi:hypothetical protein
MYNEEIPRIPPPSSDRIRRGVLVSIQHSRDWFGWVWMMRREIWGKLRCP